jgi:dTDP-N-acetylfucosamine:lipid II N-acetylfucosaminyltransferase
MNLHIAPDNTFTNKFYENLQELGLTNNNKVVIRSNEKKLKSIKRALPFAPLYSSRFENLVGDTLEYEKVFIHYFTPLMYRWVARHEFRELNWMVWGGDLYNVPSLDSSCYEPLTYEKFVKRNRSWQTKLYHFKILLAQSRFSKKAYAQISNILTWMKEEYTFAIEHLPIDAQHKFFFYENEVPYHRLDALTTRVKGPGRTLLIVGNSGSPTNNHLDAIQFLEENRVNADLIVPLSYGDPHYISFLKKEIKFSNGKVTLLERFMPFEEYLNLIASSDGLIMNSLRPQGYGNIFMMMYLGKPVYLNPKNISLPDLDRAGLKWLPINVLSSPGHFKADLINKEAVINFLSHDRLIREYRRLFC